MVDADLSVALAVLRIVRGWTQNDLAKASGIPNSSISDYERGKKVPSLKTLERLTAAMGFSIQWVERTQRFIQAVRSESLLTDLAMGEWPGERPSLEEAAEPPDLGSAFPAAWQWEVDQLSAEAGRVVSRLTRTMLVLMSRTSRPLPSEPDGGGDERRPK